MKNARTLAVVHTHTHTHDDLINIKKISINSALFSIYKTDWL